jgi:hypothetical protein
MARRWWKIGHLAPGAEVRERGSTLHFEANWKLKMVVNGFGAIVTAIVTIVFAATKFVNGAWIVIILTPTLVAIFFSIHRHYRSLAASLSLDRSKPRIQLKRHRVILPLSGVNEGSLIALHYARLLSDDITAVYICMNPVEAESIQKKWEVWGEGVRLVILDSPYRLLIEPLLDFIGDVTKKDCHNRCTAICTSYLVAQPASHANRHLVAFCIVV